MCLKWWREGNDLKTLDEPLSFYDEAINLIDLNDYEGAVKSIKRNTSFLVPVSSSFPYDFAGKTFVLSKATTSSSSK